MLDRSFDGQSTHGSVTKLQVTVETRVLDGRAAPEVGRAAGGESVAVSRVWKRRIQKDAPRDVGIQEDL